MESVLPGTATNSGILRRPLQNHQPAAYGVFYAIDEAQSKAFIADIEPDRRASAIGVYNFVTGLIYLPASLIAGALWLLHPASAFFVAGGLAFLAIAALLALRPEQERAGSSA